MEQLIDDLIVYYFGLSLILNISYF